jgi:hypothetical protein
LYIAQPLNNILFFVGPGAVNSPFVDILFPTPVVEAEGQVDIVARGAIDIPYVVEAEGSTPIVAHGDIDFPFASAYGTADVFYDTNGNIIFAKPRIDSEATADIHAWGNVRLTVPQAQGIAAPFGTVVFPALQVNAEAVNPVIIDGDVRLTVPVVSGAGVFGQAPIGVVAFPMARVDSTATVHPVAQGAVVLSVPVVAGFAVYELVAQGAVVMPRPVVVSVSQSVHSFEPISYEPDCGLSAGV